MDDTTSTPGMDPGTGTGADASADTGGAEEWPGADTISGSSEPDAGASGGRGQAARDTLGQLQSMIDTITTQAAPVARQIGAKAAELAAVAADHAGPFARRAADVTEEAGSRLAERSRALAEELRRDVGGAGDGSNGSATAPPSTDAPSAPESPSPDAGTDTPTSYGS
jgi:hypothetical protein